jgi:hypothetical protein
MEETMKLYWTVLDLLHLSRRELCELADRLLDALRDFEPGSVQRHELLISIANIRRVQARRHEPR